MTTKSTSGPVLRPAGLAYLNVNGKINTVEISRRTRMTNAGPNDAGPLYPMLSGSQPFDIFPGDVLVRYKDDRTGYNVMATVNGFGNSSEDIEDQRKKLVFAGIAVGQGVRMNPNGNNGQAEYPSLLCAVQVFGEDRLINTGPDSIDIGDELYWDLPDTRNYYKDEKLLRIPFAIRVYKPELSLRQKDSLKSSLSTEDNARKTRQKHHRVDEGAVKVDNAIMFLIDLGKKIGDNKTIDKNAIRKYLFANGTLSGVSDPDLDDRREKFLDNLFSGVLAIDKDKKDRVFATAIHKAPSCGNMFHADFHTF